MCSDTSLAKRGDGNQGHSVRVEKAKRLPQCCDGLSAKMTPYRRAEPGRLANRSGAGTGQEHRTVCSGPPPLHPPSHSDYRLEPRVLAWLGAWETCAPVTNGSKGLSQKACDCLRGHG